MKPKESLDIKLKPCPFCGGEAKLESLRERVFYSPVKWHFRLKCKKCYLTTAYMESVELLYNYWNTRS